MINGAPTCSCNSGFRLGNDGSTCTGYYISIVHALQYVHNIMFQILMSARMNLYVKKVVLTLLEHTHVHVGMVTC